MTTCPNIPLKLLGIVSIRTFMTIMTNQEPEGSAREAMLDNTHDILTFAAILWPTLPTDELQRLIRDQTMFPFGPRENWQADLLKLKERMTP